MEKEPRKGLESLLIKRGSGSRPGSISDDAAATLFRGIIFSILPSLIFGLFHNNFIAVDIYWRNMAPIYNMASPLPEKDQQRLSVAQKGTTAHCSMLLDFISTNLLSCIVLAGDTGEYWLILGLPLATFCNLAYIIIANLFSFEYIVIHGEDGTKDDY
ncbi:hypothetical protein QBC38DRAFT_461587 [Podospora fimiseda]|uniref:Uncharacterized protein n=1 Tax=Podospora fimiseda TaxID=252190 RepID=A0AAN6YMP2_9PEZI|nr:hypothetical protein QBC38DRAFT_461587 [Podospora fimiseda]